MNLVKHLWTMWKYSTLDTSGAGVGVGWDMFRENLEAGEERHLIPGMAPQPFGTLGKQWAAMTESEKEAALAEKVAVENDCYAELSAAFRANDRAAFEQVIQDYRAKKAEEAAGKKGKGGKKNKAADGVDETPGAKEEK